MINLRITINKRKKGNEEKCHQRNENVSQDINPMTYNQSLQFSDFFFYFLFSL